MFALMRLLVSFLNTTSGGSRDRCRGMFGRQSRRCCCCSCWLRCCCSGATQRCWRCLFGRNSQRRNAALNKCNDFRKARLTTCIAYEPLELVSVQRELHSSDLVRFLVAMFAQHCGNLLRLHRRKPDMHHTLLELLQLADRPHSSVSWESPLPEFEGKNAGRDAPGRNGVVIEDVEHCSPVDHASCVLQLKLILADCQPRWEQTHRD